MPVLKLLVAAEIAMMAHDHFAKLNRFERRRLLQLIRMGRGRRRNLTDEEREELAELISKMEPRLLIGLTLDRLSPINLPLRVVEGPRRNRRQRREHT